MTRRPHFPSRLELLRLFAEHVTGVALMLVGLVVGAFLRDDLHRPALLDLAAWSDLEATAAYLRSFAERLTRFGPKLHLHVLWDVLAVLALQYAMVLNGLYDRQPVRRARNLLVRLVRAALFALVGISVVFFVTRPPELGRTALVIGYGLTVLALWGARTAWQRVARTTPERIVVLGEGPACAQAVAAARGAPFPGCEVVGYLGRPHATAGAAHLGDWSALEGVLAERSVDRLLLASAPPDGRDLGSVVAARLDGISVMSARDFAENLTGEVPEDDLGPEFVTDATSRAYGRVMRLVDVVLAALLLVLLSPLLLGAMLAILATSGRPALFVQDRVGQGGVAYACFKLRTMRPDSEKDGPSWSGRGDPRVTAIGRLLRRWRLDELPQLVNVLRGEMAFVGPRPEQPYFVDRLSRSLPGYGLRHLVRPGITGWAQVRMPYGSSEEDARRKLRCDLFYVKHRSALLDLAILFDTVRVALRGEGR